MLTKHVHYVYDSFDHEIGKQVDDTGGGSYDRAESYVLDASPATPLADKPSGALADPLLQFAQNGNLQFRYFNGPSPSGDHAVYTEEQIGTPGQAGTEYWPVGDNENTPHEVVSNASAVVDHVVTNTFGVVTSESNTSIHHWAGFEGGHFDPDTAMVDNYFRWYDPPAGRWLDEDPKGFDAHDMNLERVVANSPTTHADPTRLYAWGWPSWNDYTHYLWNPSQMDPDLQSYQAFAVGVSVGAVTTGAVILAAPAAVYGGTQLLTAAGVANAAPIAQATVSVSLFATTLTGTANTAYNTYQAYNAGNWNQIYFNAGSLTGGLLVGSFGGGQYMQLGITGKPSQAPNTWNFFALMAAEFKLKYNPSLGPPWSLQWWASSPTPTSAGFSATMASGNIMPWIYANFMPWMMSWF